jgi:DNA-binding PadR family transcriptional regulator
MREVYSLTARGKQELFRRLNEFGAKDAASEGAFRMRVGMFFVFDAAARARILQARDEFLERRETKLVNLASAMQLGKWGDEVTSFLLQQVRAERKWISKLKKKK